jgi:hypothetical protein
VALTSPELQALEEQVPRDIARTVTRGDRIFRTLCASAAAVSLFIIGGTALFLAIKAVPALQKAGLLSFFTTSVWNPTVGDFGVLGLLIGTIIIATVSLIVAALRAMIQLFTDPSHWEKTQHGLTLDHGEGRGDAAWAKPPVHEAPVTPEVEEKSLNQS